MKVYVIPVSGDVEPAMAAFIARCIQEARQSPDALVVLEMNTFGGRVDAALEIVDTMLTVPKERSLAFVKTKAISAGALIGLSCGSLYMKTNTTLGDCAPLMYTDDGPKMLGEKFQSPLRAKFRALAQRNGYPEALTAALVSDVVVVIQFVINDSTYFLDSTAFNELPAGRKKLITQKKTVVSRGTLLTMSAEEAVDLRFSKKTVESVDDMLKARGNTNYEIIAMQESWSEKLARFITKISPILMMIGFAALYMEFKSPGFGIPGVIGIICIATVFLAQYMVGLANYTELLLILIGIVLIGLEIFATPGMLILGILGILSIGAGLVLSLQDFVVPEPSMPWQLDLLLWNTLQVLGSICAAFIVSLLFLRFVFPKIGMVVKGPYLNETLKTYHADSDELKTVTVGDKGVAATLLRPAGKALIGGDRHDVVAEGEFIEKNTPIVVIQINQNRIIVRRTASGPGEKADA